MRRLKLPFGMRPHQVLPTVGLLLIVWALWLAASTAYGSFCAGRASQRIVAQLAEEFAAEEVETIHALSPDDDAMPSVNVDDTDYLGIIAVPTLGMELPVASSWSDEQLRISPCTYDGSYLADDLVICGEGYASQFGRLRSIGIASKVHLSIPGGSAIDYVVSNVEVERLEEIGAIMDDWDLTLFTFNVDGSCLVVRCVRSVR